MKFKVGDRIRFNWTYGSRHVDGIGTIIRVEDRYGDSGYPYVVQADPGYLTDDRGPAIPNGNVGLFATAELTSLEGES